MYKYRDMKKGAKDYYTAKELADTLSLNVMTIYRWIESEKLQAYKIGKEFRIERKEFEKFMNKSKHEKN
jgi:excisionase family DNA binding protein